MLFDPMQLPKHANKMLGKGEIAYAIYWAFQIVLHKGLP